MAKTSVPKTAPVSTKLAQIRVSPDIKDALKMQGIRDKHSLRVAAESAIVDYVNAKARATLKEAER